MLLPPILITLLPIVAASSPTPAVPLKGVPSSSAHLYTAPKSGKTWTCLDGKRSIPYSALNDDYCDCEDGSDEPGTSACANGTFHCLNEGHIGGKIPSSRVNDGLCEPECCDGSDEREGVCPNRCQEIGAAYREEQAALTKRRRTGAKIRSTYLAFAQKEKTRLEAAIETLKKEVDVKLAEVSRTQDILGRVESMDAAAMELKKQSPLYASLQKHNAAIKALDARSKKFQETITQLETLLNDLESGFNPNYVDMAVINTVKAWKALKADEDAEPAEKTDAQDEEADAAPEEEDKETEEDKEDAKWTDWEITQLTKNTDYVSLMLDHERHVSKAGEDQVKSLLYSMEDYLPDALLPTYTSFKSTLLQTLSTIGIIPKAIDTSEETTQARKAHNDATSALAAKEGELRREETALSKLFDAEWYGKDGAWRKLDGTCLSKDTGEYTYSVCLFAGATQKSNRDGASNNLGSFTSWSKSPSVAGEYDYYTTQHYEHGAQCWNGPQRSVTLHLSCGTENELLTVSEPEKCEYHFTGRTPALCLPLGVENGAKGGVGKDKEEL